MQDATSAMHAIVRRRFRNCSPVISRTYENKLKEEKHKWLPRVILTSGFGLIILLIALMFIFYQMKRLNVARKAVNTMNEELKHINSDLHTLNDKLQESNQVKEEYIGYVFIMCSIYQQAGRTTENVSARKIKTSN